MGGYKPVLKKITVLGRMNDINIQAEFEVEYEPEKIRFITMLNDFTEKLRLGGLQPPVGKTPIERKWSDNQTKANGEHPLDKLPYVDDWGDPVFCPVCHKPQVIISGVVGPGKQNSGKDWHKAICDDRKCSYKGKFLD